MGGRVKKVLIIDDDEMHLVLVRQILDSEECSVLSTADGPHGITLYKDHRPDLVLLDLEMPVKDGFAALAEIRKDPRFAGIPVMAVTAKAMPLDRDRILTAGFDACITKPIDVKLLKEKILQFFKK
jgi:CheY-like chemotaxis protein